MKNPLPYLSRTLIFVAAVIFTALSCVFDAPKAEESISYTPDLPLSERLAIDDARVFFAEYAKSLNPFPRYDTRNAEEDIPPPIVLWAEAVYSEFLGHEVIEAPMMGFRIAVYHPDDPGIEGWGDETPPENAVGRLICGLDPNGEIYYRLLYMVPDPQFLSEKGLDIGDFGLWDTSEDFSGSLRLFEVTGEFVKGFTVSRGDIIRYMFPVKGTPCSDDDTSSGESPTGETRAEEPCFQVPDTFWIDYSYWKSDPYYDENGGSTGTLVVGSRQVTIYRNDCPPSGGGSVGGDTDPGTGGGGGPGGDNDRERCPICQTYGNCACCVECQTNHCYCRLCHREACTCCYECYHIKEECTCCTVCHKKVCECKVSEDPCENFRSKLKSPEFMGKLHALRSRTSSGNYREYGYKFKLGPNGGYIFSNEIQGSNTDQTIDFSGGFVPGDLYFDGFIHSHYPGCGNIFSFGDLFTMAQARLCARNFSTFTFGLVTPYGFYFLSIDDWQQYLQFVGNCMYWDNNSNQWVFTEFGMSMQDLFLRSGLNTSTPQTDAELLFARFINENNIGLKLLKYNSSYNRFEGILYNPATGETYIDWCPQQ